jgi:peptidoglycan/xylan/chitin deacetylase (PgdA/CDA1 family)
VYNRRDLEHHFRRFLPAALVVSAIGACSSEPRSGASDTSGAQGGQSDVGNTQGNLSGSSGAAGAATGNMTTGSGSGGNAAGAGGAGSSGGSGSGNEGGVGTVTFPGGAVAAVSLTYDDGLDPHLAVVGPLLDAHGMKGTFFLSNFEGVDHQWALPNLKDPLNARHMAWQAMGQKGHELAGHTVNHPCNSTTKAPNYHLTDYDMTRMATELDDDVARMKRLGAVTPFTFAYPCASDKAGIGPTGQDYSPLVATRFFAARTSDASIADPKAVVLLKIPMLDTGGKTGDQLRAMVDQAIAQKGWLVLLFHGVGVETTCPKLDYQPSVCMINYLVTSADAHQSLIEYLDSKKAQVWTAPFKEVAQRLQSQR